jgi:hypothetical protein
MKTISKISAVCAVALSLNAVSFAADAQWELFTGGLGSFDMRTSGTTAATTTVSSWGLVTPLTAVTPTIGYMLGSGAFELLLNPVFNSDGATTATTTIGVQAGVAYNFGGNNAEDNFYARILVGFNSTSTGATSNLYLQEQVGFGKRFKLVDHVSYAPEVSFRMINTSVTVGAANTSIFSIVPVQFTMQM